MPAKLTQSEVSKRIKAIHKGKIELIGHYDGYNDKTRFRCTVDGHEWETEPNMVLYRTGCPKCAGTIKLTQKEVNKRIAAIHKGRIKMIGDYVNSRTKTTFECKKGHRWETTTGNILNRGSGCSKCKKKKVSKKKVSKKKVSKKTHKSIS